MPSNGNRRRPSRKRERETSLWGSLFRKSPREEDYVNGSFYGATEEQPEETPDTGRSLLRQVWLRFSFWSTLALLLYAAFLGTLAFIVVNMWSPQDLSDIAGYSDKGNSKDLEAQLSNAAGAPISFTEGEINRYLRDTCRQRQTGILSIITHTQGIALRIHDGYGELIIDRIIGANLHQTTAVFLTFTQSLTHGKPELSLQFKGNESFFGTAPQGGRIGQLGIPQRYIKTLRPALETLLSSYAGIASLIERHGYKPVFVRGSNGEDSCVRLVPYAPDSSPPVDSP